MGSETKAHAARDNHQGCAVYAGNVVARVMHGVLATAFCQGFGFLARFPSRCALSQGPLNSYLPFKLPIPILRPSLCRLIFLFPFFSQVSPLPRHRRRAEQTGLQHQVRSGSFPHATRHFGATTFHPTTFWRRALARSFTPRIASPHATDLFPKTSSDRSSPRLTTTFAPF